MGTEKTSSVNIQFRIELGNQYFRDLKYDFAEKEFKEILGLPLNNVQAEQVRVSLGDIYYIKGKHDLAMLEFRKALEINPGNNKLKIWLERIDEIPVSRRGIPPYRVFFTWGMHYQCNYRCSYCNAPKPEKVCFNEEPKNCANYLEVQEWVKTWQRIYQKYGPCRIRLDGGEPSAYPSFMELVESISKYHYLQINTNLSFDAVSFINRINPDRVRVDASFHPEYVSLEDFLVKIKILHKYKFEIVVNCVGYPPLLDKMNEYKRPFKDMQVPFVIHPFNGKYNSKDYPKAYEIDEVSKICSSEEISKTMMSWRKGENNINITKGKLCRMGQMYGRIYPNGDVYRCCIERGYFNIGNLCDEAFSLLEESLPCERQDCFCWKSMVVGEEERWLPQWLDSWERR